MKIVLTQGRLALPQLRQIARDHITLLIDATLSCLPKFLLRDGGVNSGLVIAHVTTAALASENKTLAHSPSADSLPPVGIHNPASGWDCRAQMPFRPAMAAALSAVLDDR